MLYTDKQQITFVEPQPPKNKSYLAETRERMRVYGRRALSNHEVLSLITGSALGVAQIKARYGDKFRPLTQISTDNLVNLGGIGEVSACRIMAAIELGYRLAKETRPDIPQIKSPEDAANLMAIEMRDLEQEHFKVLLLDTKNHVLASPTIYIGTANTAVIRVTEVMRPAITVNATAIIMVHNHPSGDPTPSPEDIHVTQRVIEAGKMLDIEVLDHVIIGSNKHTSFKERGLI